MPTSHSPKRRAEPRRRWAQCLLILSIAGISVLGDWVPHRAMAEKALVREYVAEQQLVAQREQRVAVIAETLEDIAADLRRIRPKGEDSPTLASVQAGTGERAPLTLAESVLARFDSLGDFETQIEADWLEETQSMRERGLPAEIIDRQAELLSEVRARAAEFRQRIANLRSEYARRSIAGSSDALIELADWLAPLQSARGYKAIDAEQLPLQFARPENTPAPGIDLPAEAKSAKAFTDPPGPADLAPTLDAPFTPAVQALAAELNNDPVAIRSWVYNNIEFQPTFGSIQGADLTLLNRSGNAFDIASLTIALLRSAGTPARYVRSVVELPVEQVQNWLGKLQTPQMALDLLQKGGVPAGAVIVAGRIKAIQFEHVWIEAYVDFIPSRAAINRVPDQWVPLDVAFKQYEYEDAVPWRQMSLNARQNVVLDFASQLSVDSAGGISGFDFDLINRSMADIATQLATDLRVADPEVSVEDFYDKREIREINSLIIAGTLPFPLRSAIVQRYSEVPAASRHTVRIQLFTDQASLNLGFASREVSLPTARLGNKRLAVNYAPATPADAQTINAYASDNSLTIPLGQIRVKPELRLADELLFELGAGRMGEMHFWKVDTRDIHGNQTNTEAYRFPAGSQLVFSANLAGMSAQRVEAENADREDYATLPIHEALALAGQLYWMMHDHTDDQAARTVNGRALRVASVGAFATNVQVRYFFGVPRTGFTAGYLTDVKAVGIALSTPQADQVIPTALHIGSAGSLAEGATWPLLSGSSFDQMGISTTTLLKTAIDQGQRLFQISHTNVDAALAEMQLSSDAENEIRSVVGNGLIVVAHEKEVSFRNWSGAGYVILSPSTGASLQRIEGGFSGGIDIGCLLKAVVLTALCKTKIFKAASSFLNLISTIGSATATFKEIAMAALETLLLSALIAIGVVIPIIGAVITAISIAIAVMETIRWLREIMDGVANLTEEEMAELGITSVNDLICNHMPACFEGLNEVISWFSDEEEPTEDERAVGGPAVGNPVVVGTGAKWQREVDFEGAGPFPLRFIRTYNSAAPRADGWVGMKWISTYMQSLRLPPAVDGSAFPVEERPNNILIWRPDGGWLQFSWRDNAYITEANLPGELTRLTNGGVTTGWRLKTPQDTTEHFDAQGHLLSISNRAGLQHSITHDPYFRPIQVTDSYGRTLHFEYDEDSGYLSSMTDPMGRETRYTHDEFGNLALAQYADSTTREYHFEDITNRNSLTGITDERGTRVSTWEYDHNGRVSRYHRAGDADQHTFAYAKDQTSVTDPLGTVRTYQYQRIFDRPYLKQVTQPCSSCGAGDVAETTYDSRGLIASRKDFRDFETRYARNNRGLIETLTEAVATPQARVTRKSWHPDYYLPTRFEDPITGGIRVTNLTYDGEGNLIGKTVITPTETRQWSYSNNDNGQRLSSDGPRTDVVDVMSYSYHPDGTLATRTDEVGHQWQYTDYDADGQLRRMVDPNGLITTYRYDDRQRLIEVKEDDEVTAYRYDGAGNLTRITLPDNSYLEYVYDGAERIEQVRDNLGHRIVYTLDGQGNRTVEERFDRNGDLLQTMRRVFDGIGRLKEHYGAEDQLTQYGYDPNNNETRITDPLNHLTQHSYDALDRLRQTIDPILGEIDFAYDPQDNLTQVADPRNVTTTYAYNGYDELTRLTSPDTGITNYGYDPAGNLKTRTDARGVAANYQYDANNRLTQIAYPAFGGQPAETLSFVYDDTANGNAGKGRLTSIADGSGSTRFQYDLHGRVIAKTQSVGTGSPRTLQTSYQPNGRVDGHVLPSGAVCRYTYRADGRVLSISVNGVEIVREIDYFAFGEPRSWDYAGNGEYRREFDSDGRIREHSAGSATRTIGFDPASRITALTDAPAAGSRNDWAFDYDDLDRLTDADNAAAQGPVAGTDLNWDYDPTGNRTSETSGANPSVAYTIDPDSNKLLQVGSDTRSYDEVGNTLNDGLGTISVYSPRNRLIQTTKAGLSTTYAHNAFGERVCKAIDSVQACPTATDRIEYVYDDNGHLIGEYPVGGSAAQAVEYVWLDDVPVAVLHRRVGSSDGGPTGGGAATAWTGTVAGGVDVYYLHPDHLDTPRVVVNAQNQTIWRWDSAPFGDTLADEQPSGGLASYSFNLRFPGQQFDRETGAHYNYFRDYEAGTGRYLQSDPIGLWGGLDVFSYVNGEPLYWTDREGLGRRGPKPGTPPAPARPNRFDGGGLTKPGDKYPPGGGLYDFVDTCTGEVLYKGKAANFRTRYHNHNKPGGRLEAAENYCGCSVVMMPYALENDPNIRDQRERRDVRRTSPPGNQMFTGRRRRF